jgi:predicted HD superfamily hydrolase involved in NAD metabolism
MTPLKLLEIQSWVAEQVSPYRLRHIQGVVHTSEKLARRLGLPVEKARLAAWLHDSAKEKTRLEMKKWIQKAGFHLDALEKKMPGLWHPHAGAAIALEKWGIKDKSVLEAIRCHTLGSPKMGPLAQLVFVADFIEPSRDFIGVHKVRATARRNLKEAVLAKASMTIRFLLEKRMKIHPRLLETWNQFLLG